jgi:hypothetical protein
LAGTILARAAQGDSIYWRHEGLVLVGPAVLPNAFHDFHRHTAVKTIGWLRRAEKSQVIVETDLGPNAPEPPERRNRSKTVRTRETMKTILSPEELAMNLEPCLDCAPPCAPNGRPWRRAIDTALPSPQDIVELDAGPAVAAHSVYRVAPYAMLMLIDEG